MAFVKKIWKNRVSEFFNRYRLENVSTGQITNAYINLNDGAVEEEGDKINAEALNDLEDRIEAALEGVGTGSNFVGTKAEWNALTDEEKAQYDTYDLIDDFEGYIVDNAVNSGSTNPVTSGAVANHLVAGNKKFYFDYHDGEYGYNTSANRGADTFHPFKQTNIGECEGYSGSANISATPGQYFAVSSYNPMQFTGANIVTSKQMAYSGSVTYSVWQYIIQADAATINMVCQRVYSTVYIFVVCPIS